MLTTQSSGASRWSRSPRDVPELSLLSSKCVTLFAARVAGIPTLDLLERTAILMLGRRSGRVYRPKPFVAVYVLLLGVAAVAAWAVYAGLRAWIPGADKDGLDAAKTALAVVAGSGAGAALYLNYRKQRLDEIGDFRESDRLFTDRFTKAAEQLGHSAAAVRLAGMYSLARIADDSARDRDTCMSVLCAYLRMPYDPLAPDADPTERNVRLTAQRLIEDRLTPWHPHFWADAEVDLRGACLIEAAFGAARIHKALFNNARFHGYTIFGKTEFMWRTWFDGAQFHDSVWFGYSEFHDQTSFEATHFYSEARFHNAAFMFPVTTFEGAAFDAQAEFQDVSLRYPIDFERASFSADHPPVWPEDSVFEDEKLLFRGVLDEDGHAAGG